jgi:hypothetical protein
VCHQEDLPRTVSPHRYEHVALATARFPGGRTRRSTARSGCRHAPAVQVLPRGSIAAVDLPKRNVLASPVHLEVLTQAIRPQQLTHCNAGLLRETPCKLSGSTLEDDDLLMMLRLGQNHIIHPTAAERGPLVEAVAPVVARQRRILGQQLFRRLEA